MKITIVLLHYWKERSKNITQIAKDLRNGSRKPDSVILFNNNPEVRLPYSINSNINYGGRARHVIALLEPSDYYYFIDDDTTVCEKTLENFANHAYKGCCLGYRGKILTDSYQNSLDIWGNSLSKPKKVDLLTGNGTIFVCRLVLLRVFNKPASREDDLALSMGNNPKVIPANQDEFISNLPDGGVGYCLDPKHWEFRNKAAKLCRK
jgi:hypothetical protein